MSKRPSGRKRSRVRGEWGIEHVRLGNIKVLLDSALPLEEAAQAHRLVAENQVAGNVVLLPWS